MTADLSVADAAAELNCGIDTIHRAIRRGDLTAFKYGRLIRISRKDLDAFIATHSARPTTPARRRRTSVTA